MGPIQNNQEKEEKQTAQPAQNAIIHFPVITKKKVHKGMHSIRGWVIKLRPVLFAAFVSTIFASLAFTVIDPELAGQPVLTEKAEQPAEQNTPGSTSAAVVPEQSLWVVQAGVFKEAASAETSLKEIEANMPVIQTPYEEFTALWVGAASDEKSAQEIASLYQQDAELYVKQVVRPGGELELSDNDSKWLHSAVAFTEILLNGSIDQQAGENLVASPPDSEVLTPFYTSIKELAALKETKKTELDRAVLHVVEELWELPQKNM
ncbi:hypothetical protein [Jeotgalibacillus proteolyticus]|uniref:SPOR domain-containing protein n=1 Tax=Jeotgalibacillus proteolyticus TaxID=2082395 RepID=A0A2S5GF31_9BACL|nr:hypothetical protein [Jeotgalibacillus proteolyticus]PPA71548.1 hypothetical protein C4B60_05670 [Jeotgalibacillus proteolyticus]